jgi:hypothetical protein
MKATTSIQIRELVRAVMTTRPFLLQAFRGCHCITQSSVISHWPKKDLSGLDIITTLRYISLLEYD